MRRYRYDFGNEDEGGWRVDLDLLRKKVIDCPAAGWRSVDNKNDGKDRKKKCVVKEMKNKERRIQS